MPAKPDDSDPSIQRSRRREVRYLFLIFFVLYALTSPGHVQGDSSVRWRVATQIVETGWIALPDDAKHLTVRGEDGRLYSFFGIGQSLCMVPIVIAGKIGAAVLPLPGGEPDDVLGAFLASLVLFPFCGALAVVLLSTVVRELTGDGRTARWVAVLYGVATMHWHHTVNTYEASQVSVLVLVCVWASLRSWRTDTFRFPWLAMAAAGAAILFRLPSVVMTAPFLLVVFLHDLRQREQGARLDRLGQWLLAGLLGVIPAILVIAVLNTVRFGDPLSAGYSDYVGTWLADEQGELVMRLEDRPLFSTPLFVGLGGMLLSPGKSVFLFSPILLLTLPGFVGLWRLNRALTLAIAALLCSSLLFHAKYLYWSGDLAWGPRYLATALGPWCLALVPIIAARRWRPLVLGLAALSVSVQVISVVYGFNTEFLQNPAHTTVPDGYVWRVRESQLVCRVENIYLDVTGRPVPRFGPDDPFPPAYKQAIGDSHAPPVNMYPFQARGGTRNTSVLRVLFLSWLGGFIGLGTLVVFWLRRAALDAEGSSEASPPAPDADH